MRSKAHIEQESLKNLQALIEINLDSAAGFKTASDETEVSRHKTLLRDQAIERERFAHELQDELRRLGDVAETDGSWKASVHRWWMDARNTLSSDERDLYAEMERGEEAILKKYQETVKDVQGWPVHAVVQRQLEAIKAGHDRIQDLRRAAD
ncbi:MAG: PA2169 family four-helix-bundle protein [Planctomycetota bacterium]